MYPEVYNASDVAHYIRFFGMRKPVQTRRQYNKSVNCKWPSERKLAKLALSLLINVTLQNDGVGYR